jgi:ribulose-5-phosphate 4-epimerase/fuculose-1-phosphate aldolase
MTVETASTPDLAELKADVALANRIVHYAGLVSAFGHVSARVPGTDSFLIPTRASPALAHPDRLIRIDFNGNRLEGEGMPNTEFWIHARIYAARPDIGAVAHVHAPACVVLGQIGQTVRVMHNSAAAFGDGVPVFERPGLIRSSELGDQVARALGARRGMLLRGHGANVVEANVRWVAVLACFMEEAAGYQLRALNAAGGDPKRIRYYTPEETARLRDELDNEGPMNRAWEYYAAVAESPVQGLNGAHESQ